MFYFAAKVELNNYAVIGKASIQGADAWSREGITVSLMGDLPATLYTGDKFDNNCAVVWPMKAEDLLAIWAFCQSIDFCERVRKIDQSIKVTNQTLLKIPFDLEHWQKVAEKKYPNGLPEPYSDDTTQWLFHSHPSHAKEPLQVAVARLVGYRWPAPCCPLRGMRGRASF